MVKKPFWAERFEIIYEKEFKVFVNLHCNFIFVCTRAYFICRINTKQLRKRTCRKSGYKTKSGMSLLDIEGATYSEDKIIINAGENGCLPGYEDYYDIYTYSEDKHYWECHSYDANGIEAKPSEHAADDGDVCWCWYYGDEGCDGSIALTEGYVRDEF